MGIQHPNPHRDGVQKLLELFLTVAHLGIKLGIGNGDRRLPRQQLQNLHPILGKGPYHQIIFQINDALKLTLIEEGHA